MCADKISLLLSIVFIVFIVFVVYDYTLDTMDLFSQKDTCKWYNVGKCDGEWRKREAEDLKSAVRSTIIKSQNPPNCTAAKKLVCHQNHEVCGLGCQMNHLSHCLITALATGRVLIITEDQGMPHYGNITVTQFFMPVSETCIHFEGPSSPTWEVSGNDSARVVEHIPDWNLLGRNNAPYNPPALPTKLADRIYRQSLDPDAWWVGQMVGYLMRPSPKIQQFLKDADKTIDFTTPVVGIHVRRGDKIHQPGAGYHQVEKYMEQAELWYKRYERSHQKVSRRVFLASDDPKVLQECQEKYPHYTVFTLENILLNSNCTEAPLLGGIVQEMHLLSLTHFVVCTHSSNVCMLIYPLMHFNRGDGSEMVYSLDTTWHAMYPYLKYMLFEAVMDDFNTNLIQRDQLKSYIFPVDGVSDVNQTVEAINLRTNEKHKYPLFKLKKIPQTYEFASFEEIDEILNVV